MFEKLKADFAHYRNSGSLNNLGFWVGAAYRFGNWSENAPQPARLVARATYKCLVGPIKFFRSVYIPPGTNIGKGFCLHHPQNIVISSRTVIGENCTVYQEVTMGGGGANPGLPTLGNNVTVYAGARILGGVKIGDNVQIGANAVVNTDVPEGAVVPSPSSRPLTREMVKKMEAARKKAQEKKESAKS